MTAAPTKTETSEDRAWHSQSAEGVLAQLGSAAAGLSAQEAAKRLAANGPNDLKEAKAISPWAIFLPHQESLRATSCAVCAAELFEHSIQ